MIVHMIGNAHLDPVWLWPWQSGADEALATFSHAVARCDETPEFIYTRGEAWLFSLVEKLDPDLFERARELVRSGRWQIVGGQWVQPDCNLPTLDGWNAQLEIGARYFAEKFGVQTRVGYNVDSFGHPATLPDILAAHGLESYCFHRPGPHQVELPAQTFRWRGAGGAEVTAFRIAQAYVTRTDDLYGQIQLTLEAADAKLGHTMCFYGVGNHGGGPTKGNLEYILENQNFAPDVELRFSHPQAFFDAIKGADLPVVESELQRTFPGCYSVMADIKRAQHRGEQQLAQTAQIVEAFSIGDAKSARIERLNNAWRDLSFTAFHDILAGTSASQTWDSVRAMQGRARIEAEEIALETTRIWARKKLPKINHQQIALFNSSDETWRGTVEHEPFLDFDFWENRWISDEDGQPIPFQRVQPDANILLSNRIIFETQIAPRSTRIILVRDDEKPNDEFSSDLQTGEGRMSNSHWKVEVGATGARFLRDGKTFDLRFHLRRDNSDTWTFTQNRFHEDVFAAAENWNWQTEESGPIRARFRGECGVGDSRLRMTLDLNHAREAIEWRLEVGWNERYALLQMTVMGDESVEGRRDGLAGGGIERARDEFEHPFQKWSKWGELALVSPDVYSVSALQTGAQFSLLRASRMAWGGGDPEIFGGRETFTDQGFHVFEGVFVGDESPETLDAIYRNLVRRPIVFDRYEGLDRPPWGNAPRTALWTGAEQRARRDGKMPHLQDDGARDVLAAPDGELPAEIEEVL